MILVVGSGLDSVFPKVVAALEAGRHPFAVVDEDRPEPYAVQVDGGAGGRTFRIYGGDCTGGRPVGAIFVRHAVLRSLDPGHAQRLGALQADLNRLLFAATCPVVNPPANALSNYSKPYQAQLLAEAGFDVPRTLVTNVPDVARRFYEKCGGRVIFKGVSNVMTLAQVLTPDRLPRIELLPNSPTLFQEYVEGVDYRVHVIGDGVWVTRLASRNEDYRRSLLVDQEDVAVEPASLPAEVAARCVEVTRRLGLVVSGIDFKGTPAGRLVALELNPFPQFSFYEGRSGQPITASVVEHLAGQQRITGTNVYA